MGYLPPIRSFRFIGENVGIFRDIGANLKEIVLMQPASDGVFASTKSRGAVVNGGIAQPYTSSYSLLLPNSTIDYAALVGDPIRNSAVGACLSWITRMWASAPLLLNQVAADGTLTPLSQHPMIHLIRRPNPNYTGLLLWKATLTSYIWSGNAYWLKRRNGAGRVVQLEYMPHMLVRPVWPQDGSTYLAGYMYATAQGMVGLPVEDVVHFRYNLDPSNPRMGYSPLLAVMREIFTDNEATAFAAALLKNMGVPGIVFTPKSPEFEVTPENAKEMKSQFKQSFAGDGRGDPMFLSGGVDVTKVAFSPADLNLDKLHNLPEERICAMLNIPPIVVGLGAGLEHSTYSNTEQAEKAAVQNGLVPLYSAIADELDTQLLYEFEANPDAYAADFNIKLIPAMAENQTAITDDAAKLYTSGIAMRSEVRQMKGLPVTPEDDIYFVPNTGTLRNGDGTPVIEPPAPPPALNGPLQPLHLLPNPKEQEAIA